MILASKTISAQTKMLFNLTKAFRISDSSGFMRAQLEAGQPYVNALIKCSCALETAMDTSRQDLYVTKRLMEGLREKLSYGQIFEHQFNVREDTLLYQLGFIHSLAGRLRLQQKDGYWRLKCDYIESRGFKKEATDEVFDSIFGPAHGFFNPTLRAVREKREDSLRLSSEAIQRFMDRCVDQFALTAPRVQDTGNLTYAALRKRAEILTQMSLYHQVYSVLLQYRYDHVE